jgi:multidrug efflux system outer membrane protein
MRKAAFTLVTLTLPLTIGISGSLVGSASAQPAPVRPAAPAGLPPATPAANTPPPGTGPAGTPAAPIEIPPAPTVNDPMLTPVPPPQRTIATWEEALAYVRARSTDLRIAYDEVRRAEGQARSALGPALTQINGTGFATHNFLTKTIPPNPPQDTPTPFGTVAAGSISRGGSSPPANYLNGGITAVQPIVNFAVWDSYGIAKANIETQKLSVEDLKRTLALNVASAIVSVVTAERIAELNRVGFRNALERHELTTRKKALGAATGLDVVRAQQDVETARAALVTGDESLRQAREALGLALGLPEQVGVARTVNINGLEQSALQVCKVADTLDSRPDIAAARQRLEVAKRGVHNVYLQFLPAVNVQSTLASTTVDLTPATTWNIQAVLQVPIWDGGARYGALRQNRALEDEALMQLESLRRTATIQITQARRGVDVADSSRKVAADARALAAETDRLTQVAYREGQGTSLELVISASALRQAEITLALREFDLVRARILAVLALATCPW